VRARECVVVTVAVVVAVEDASKHAKAHTNLHLHTIDVTDLLTNGKVHLRRCSVGRNDRNVNRVAHVLPTLDANAKHTSSVARDGVPGQM
jgi:hypothetical protein